jgi:acetyltransferase-like isoleucine patch superfamily enzyme
MFIRNLGFIYFTLYGLVKYLPMTIIGDPLRWLVLKMFVKRLGSKVYIRDGVTVWYPKNVSIGNNVTLNEWVHLNGAGGIEIGDWVRIAHGVSIISEDHEFDDLERPIAQQGARHAKVVIEDDVWLGSGVKVLKGIRIGRGAIVGAGSIVTRDIPPYGIAVGNPARVIKSRKPDAADTTGASRG